MSVGVIKRPATQAWHNTDVPMYMSSPVVDGAFVYGFSNKRKGQLFCLDAKTGTVKWATEGAPARTPRSRAQAQTSWC